ncbi:MAG: enoyl-CoA hydratase/isomerase family protein [Syntrophomonadaceae bacterium]|mgnify:CR=1 FL=1|nr:enoyl-CoA hydratase/isomerase family protein [Syntrophomonadaceae bacterium]
MLDLSIEDNTIIAKLNNPKTNSISLTVLKQLDKILDRVNDDEDIKGLILIGEGRFFSSGFCLPELTIFTDAQQAIDWFLYEEQVLLKLFCCTKPVVSCLNGHTVAGGMIFALTSDYLIALNNDRIKIGMSEIKIGLSLTPIEAEVMRWGLGSVKNYKDIIFKAENINPVRALEMGIIDELVDQPELLLERAKQKVSALIDTPSRPFIRLKKSHRRPAIIVMQQMLEECDWQPFGDSFVSEEVKNTLRQVQASME